MAGTRGLDQFLRCPFGRSEWYDGPLGAIKSSDEMGFFQLRLIRKEQNFKFRARCSLGKNVGVDKCNLHVV